MAIHYSRSTLFSIFFTTSLSRPLNYAAWKKLTQFGIARARPTLRGCRAGVRKKRAISTVITELRQSSSRLRNNYILMDDSSGNLEEMANLHRPFYNPLNIHIVTCRSVSKNCIAVERTPLLPAQRTVHLC